ncbi:MAG: zinc-binding alcohol dehydrogenase [Oscillospiraceae bacterium]|nr:zinc-binding alcohol dehydrogenase [Oscillospiraceae bacterium]
MMESRNVVFTAPWKAELLRQPVREGGLPPGHALIKKRYSLISTGTELACLSGNEGWFSMPRTAGYCCVGRILECAGDVRGFAPGDMAYYYGSHSEYEVADTSGLFVRLPEGFDARYAPLVRMATVAATALRVSQITLGDYVAVVGQGLVGNFAAQLAGLQGGRVIGVDVSPMRLGVSRKCGVEHTVNPNDGDAAAKVKGISKGLGVSTLIEATGFPPVIKGAFDYVAPKGEFILLGTPRGDYSANLAEVLTRSHLAFSDITIKGAHEWKFPTLKAPHSRYSIEGNTELMMDCIMSGRLKVEGLITDTIKPEEAPEYYGRLRADRDSCLGVQIDWD